MTMPTSDERREVAARLRKEADAWRETFQGVSAELDSGEIDAIMADAMRFCGIDDKTRADAIFDAMADLIDPTCEVVEMPDNDEFMVRAVAGYMCRACGFEAIAELNGNMSAEPPRYCPHCGARVVTGDGD